MELKINKLISKYNYYPGTVSRIKYIVIHYCGAVGSAEANARYFYGGDRNASAHYFVDEKDIWQSVEDANSAWHVGSSTYKHPECRNQNSLGIEMCCNTTGDPSKADEHWYFEDKTVERTIALTKNLMKKYNVPVDHVLRHYDVTGKVCPAPYVYNTGKHTWDQFKKAIGGAVVAENSEKHIWDYLKSKGLNDYAVAGTMGNLQAESGLRSNNLQNTYEKKLGMTDEQYTAAVDNGSYTNFIHDSAGYGLAQWTFWSRKQGLLDHCRVNNASIGDLDAQLGWLWKEFTSKSGLMNQLKNARSVREASDAVLHGYEAPADQSEAVEEQRAALGMTFYNKYSSGSPEPVVDVPFIVRVTTDSLNIRTGPGTNYPTTGEFTGKGAFTILEVKTGQGSVKGWGRLKSGAGWISLDYVERI